MAFKYGPSEEVLNQQINRSCSGMLRFDGERLLEWVDEALHASDADVIVVNA